MYDEILEYFGLYVILFMGGLFFGMKAFGIIKTKDETKREKYTSRTSKIISCSICIFVIFHLILHIITIKLHT